MKTLKRDNIVMTNIQVHAYRTIRDKTNCGQDK